jgi:SAM-dependent methyltransferase
MTQPSLTRGHGELSVVMPCYNEQATLRTVVDRVLASPFTGEVLIVDDGSRDDTLAIAQSIDDSRVRVFAQPFNMGKGAALRRGFREASLPYVVVQDADLEYDPADFATLLQPLLDDRADVVYGSRFLGGQAHRVLYFWHSVGNRVLTTTSNALTNLNLTDMETCYKVFRREIIQSIDIVEDRFGFEPEITAKVARGKWRIYEVSVSYQGRTYDEGKKITWRDGVRAMYCMFRYSALWPRRGVDSPHASQDVVGSDDALEGVLTDLEATSPQYADWVASLVTPHLGERVLEVGAGVGTMTTRIVAPGRTVVALEPSPQRASDLAQRMKASPAVTVVSGSLDDLDAGERFDTVVFVNVLEHIQDDLAALRAVRARLRPGGNVVVFAPAFGTLYGRFDRDVGHWRRYRRSDLATTLSQAGFAVPEARYVNLPGALAWWVVGRQLGLTPTASIFASAFDRAVPIIRRAEARRPPAFGQSILCVGVAS